MTRLTDPHARMRRNGLTIRAYLGTCLICRHGAFDGDQIVRGRGQHLGLMHAACARAAEIAVTGRTAPPAGSANHQGHNGAQEAQG